MSFYDSQRYSCITGSVHHLSKYIKSQNTTRHPSGFRMGENYTRILHAPSVLLSGKYTVVPISCEPR